MLKEGMLSWWDWFERVEFLGRHDPTSFINTSSGTFGATSGNTESFYYMHAVRIYEEHGEICNEIDEDLGKLVT